MIERSSGILMPISSLPSPHGIGTMGKAAYDFADFLAAAGQKYWQLLPLGPTSYGDSPYQSFSSFAGNPYFIDLDLLVKDKLLTRVEVNACDWGDDPRYVDYGKIYASRFTLLEKAKTRGFTRDREAVAAFERENERWLPNYALFMALKRHFGMKSWTEWDDEDIRCRTSGEVIERYRAELSARAGPACLRPPHSAVRAQISRFPPSSCRPATSAPRRWMPRSGRRGASPTAAG